MGNVYLDDGILTDIADAIRAKTGGSSSITPANMATEISGITTGGGGSNVVSSYTSTTSITNSTAVDTRIAAVLDDYDFDDIAFWIIRDEYNNNIYVYNKTSSFILNGTYNGVAGRYIHFNFYLYNTSYGTYKEHKITESSGTYTVPQGSYFLFVPNSGTNCYWVSISPKATITAAQKEQSTFDYTNKRSAPMSGSYYDDPTYGGKIIRQWVVANS